MTGFDHEAVTENLAYSLKRQMKPDLVRVVHDNDNLISTVFYGDYCPRTRRGPMFPTKARRDLETIKKLSTREGRRPFLFARFEPKPIESIGPPESDLCIAYDRVANGRYPIAYTLAIGVYHTTSERRDAAVEMARILREEGIEAYYYHLPSQSKVCVGAFPENAVQFVASSDPEAPAEMTIVNLELRKLKEKYPYFFENNVPRKRVVPDLDTGKPALVVYEASKLEQIPDCDGEVHLPW
jgi:hypothetical protein